MNDQRLKVVAVEKLSPPSPFNLTSACCIFFSSWREFLLTDFTTVSWHEVCNMVCAFFLEVLQHTLTIVPLNEKKMLQQSRYEMCQPSSDAASFDENQLHKGES